MPKAHVTLTKDAGYRTEIKTRDFTYYLDEPEDAGGANTAPTPTEMVMGALGSCIAMTVKMYASRKQWPLEDVIVSLDFERINSRDYPTYNGDSPFIHEIRKHITFTGDLDEEQLARLMDIAEKCPVHRLLGSPTFFVDFESDPETA